MKNRFLIVLFFFYTISAFSQNKKTKLKSGEILIDKPIKQLNSDELTYCFLVFNEMPTSERKSQISDLGVKFLEYIPDNTFSVAIQSDANISLIMSSDVKMISKILPEHKVDPKIQDNQYPDWAFTNGNLTIKVLLYKNVNLFSFISSLDRYDVKSFNNIGNSCILSINPETLYEVASINNIWYIEPIDPPSKHENKTARTLHSSNTINTSYTTGRHYNGEGIHIMMQDDGLVEPHIDRKGRVDESFCTGCSASSSNSHGDHVSGTIMGAGNLDPLGKGMADGAFLYVYSSSNNNYYDVPNLYQNNNVIITSKSYSNGCNAGYTSLAKDLDEQINLYPSLIHIFSAGNDGNSDCGYGAGSGWGNVTGGHKQAKNVIATANLTKTSGLASSSSRGPAADGRIKPDIGAKGTDVYSTMPNYDYDTKTGTSMACPGIAGVMAQLYQGYKEMNGGQNPKSGLMKCLLLNSADDIGNPGPDFKHGWGEVNAYKAIKLLENMNYINDSISQGNNNIHTINIPNNIKEVKIMTYWNDKEASANALLALVNDLDGFITDPNGVVYDPWVLDPTPNASSLDQDATRGTDHLNNMEQITIENPSSGTYTLTVSGSVIPFGPQEYFVTYEFITEDVEVTYPIGGEGLVPGEFELIRWDASEGNSAFTIEYTTDNGTTWNTITNSVGASLNYYNWQVPNYITNEARIKVSRNGFSDESDANFVIINVPTNINVNWVCPDSIFVSWGAVNGATSYEVSMLGQKYMDSIHTTTNLGEWIINPNPLVADSWFSVCAQVNGDRGRRAVAINAQPINNGCVAPPLASFLVLDTISCSGTINFIDQSLNQPSVWNWDFGDGNTSNLQNPTHTYINQGTYNVSLFVSNILGQDSIIQPSVITVNFMPGPISDNDTAYSTPSTFTFSTLSNSVYWYSDTLGSPSIASGSPFITPLLNNNTTYYVREVGGPSVYGGPLDNTIGSGGYYNNDRHLFIDSYKESILVSTDVYAGTSQAITFELRDNNSQVISDTTITVQVGLNTLNLNFNIPIMNNLELGMSTGNSDLYRNSTGSAYPYLIGNLASITGHNSPNSSTYHYFFYNLIMQETCLSEFGEATAIFIDATSLNHYTNSINVFPNPTSKVVNIETDTRLTNIKIFDIRGKNVFEDMPNTTKSSINIEKLEKGIYIIKVTTNQSVINKQLVIQ